MKKFLFLLLVCGSCFGQVKTTALKAAQIPKAIAYQGNVVTALRYTDALGDNILITTQSELTEGAELYAYHYTLKGNNWTQTWKVYDFIKECPVDIELEFLKSAITVTDLNKNNKAEVWLMYKVGCHGDVSPVNMKIIMYEDGKKQAVRGENKVQVGANDYLGGEYTFDPLFKEGPKQFRDYATQLWKKHIDGK